MTPTIGRIVHVFGPSWTGPRAAIVTGIPGVGVVDVQVFRCSVDSAVPKRLSNIRMYETDRPDVMSGCEWAEWPAMAPGTPAPAGIPGTDRASAAGAGQRIDQQQRSIDGLRCAVDNIRTEAKENRVDLDFRCARIEGDLNRLRSEVLKALSSIPGAAPISGAPAGPTPQPLTEPWNSAPSKAPTSP